ncbi:dTDP-4-dehydrorhamnose reductase [Streptomyces sp. C10-9-1]|uniref:dTDP-4-dehydrorhamnose reductase n=1 Tax=Streptomyces sp. C10-9-1 TaxID=1859285 RepID=UPI002112804C|nr:dTDP-4-dehydrorhamnose reductase [Streptomyces sp. C10-9-1]MCQ6556759.1 dTDP-4-dehydrorhamnose reductase [Streptomyces sp. C10-9-1]
MRWLVTGAGGLLGREVAQALAADGADAVLLDRRALDVTDPGAVAEAFARHRPGLLVNCAAYTAVEAAETDEERALRVNGDGPRHLASLCARHGTRLLHLSTDYVFPGDADSPYAEGHPTAPCNAYGRSKRAGERAVLGLLPDRGAVVRTAWLHGAHGPSFVRTMAERAQAREPVDVVADQVGQPTWAADVARLLLALGRVPGAHGVFHATNAGRASRYELAREVFRLVGADPGRVRPVPGAALGGRAPRPRYTVLGHDRWREAGIPAPRPWREALAESLGRAR